MLTTFERFSNALSLDRNAGRSIPDQPSHAAGTHCQSRDVGAGEVRYFDKKDSPALQQRHDLMRGKIAAYTGGGAKCPANLPQRSAANIGARYGDAIATFLNGSTQSAHVSKIDALIKEQPKNPYFEEIQRRNIC